MAMELHLGQKIFEILQEKDISKSEFARQLQTSRQNVQDILKRESLDTSLLHKICLLLNFNFFELLSSNLSNVESLSSDKQDINSLKEAQEKMMIRLGVLTEELSQIKSQID